MHSLPYEICFKIINDILPIRYNKSINKNIEKIRKEKIEKSKTIINRMIYNHHMDYMYHSNFDYYFTPKKIWKKHYPLKFRIPMMKLGLSKITSDSNEYRLNLYNSTIKYKKNIVLNFNKYIDSFTDDELFIIGW